MISLRSTFQLNAYNKDAVNGPNIVSNDYEDSS